MTYTELFGGAKFVTPSEACDTPYIRGEFDAASAVRSAVITACGLGIVELYLNGARVSDELFVPVNSDFHAYENQPCFKLFGEETAHRIWCLRYDITARMAEKNCIGAALAPGWYQPFGKVKLAFRIDITYEDGTTAEILSGDWLAWTQSPIVKWHFFHGETQDFAGIRLDGWNLVGFDASAWAQATEIDAPESNYYYQDCPADKIIRHIEPKLIAETEDVYLYDMGENITGTPIVVSTAAGETVTVRVSERLDEAGGIEDYTHHGQVFTVIPDGTDREYALRFCWFGYRYASVTKNAKIVSTAVIHTDAPVTSSFRSANKQLDWMYETYLRTQLDNMHSGIPSDCPHLEKRGYTGDGELVAECVMMMLDSKKFYRKWLYDISDCQDRVSGHVQYTAPYVRSGGGPGGWGCAIAEVPYLYYKTWGDASVLEEFREQVYRYFDYLEAHSENDLVVSDQPGEWCLGDWCVPGRQAYDSFGRPQTSPLPLIPPPYVNTYFYVKTVNRLIEFCEVLGRHGEIPALRALAEKKKAAIVRDFYDPETGNFFDNVSGANIYAIDLGLGDERTFANLTAHYEEEPWYDTGIFATDIVTRVLFEKGRADLAYKLLTSDGVHSFGRWMRDGCTTFPEYWTYQRSQNHPMFGAVIRYLHKYILGINQCGAGYRDIVIEPLCMDVLPSASGHITVDGRKIAVSYSRQADTISVDVEIPEGSTGVFKANGSEIALSAGKNHIVLR